MEHIVRSASPAIVLREILDEALKSELDSSWLLKSDFDRLLQDHVRAIVHLYRAKEHAELVIADFLVELCDDELELVDPLISQLNVLDQDPVACLSRLRDRVLDRLVQTLAHLEVM